MITEVHFKSFLMCTIFCIYFCCCCFFFITCNYLLFVMEYCKQTNHQWVTFKCFGFIYHTLWTLLSFSFWFCWSNQHTHEFSTNKHAYTIPIEDVHFLLASVVVTLFDAVIETSLYEAWLKLLTKVSSVPFLIQINLPYLNYNRTSRVVSQFC